MIFILVACTANYLLTSVNINYGYENQLVSYDNMNIPNSTCSISYKNNYVYIGVSHIITPIYAIPKNICNLDNINDIEKVDIDDKNKYMIATNTNLDAIINDNNYYIFYDNKNKYLQNKLTTIIRL